MLALFAFQASGALELVSASCEQGCLDDDAQGRCADTCTDCACCFHPRPTVRTMTFQQAPTTVVMRAVPEATTTCAGPPPGEILHVPILLA